MYLVSGKKLLSMVMVLTFAGTVSAQEPITPIEPVKEINLAKVELGKKLYFDPRLSKSGFISCNSCHNLSMGGTDNLKTSIGHNWQQVPINAPTVLNSSMNVAQFWDGRAEDLVEQAKGPILNPIEMGMPDGKTVEQKMQGIAEYQSDFAKAFPNHKPAITSKNTAEAIADFART